MKGRTIEEEQNNTMHLPPPAAAPQAAGESAYNLSITRQSRGVGLYFGSLHWGVANEQEKHHLLAQLILRISPDDTHKVLGGGIIQNGNSSIISTFILPFKHDPDSSTQAERAASALQTVAHNLRLKQPFSSKSKILSTLCRGSQLSRSPITRQQIRDSALTLP